MPGGLSSTECAPTAPLRSPETLLLFKAARRHEYLQQNLHILSAARGETVETTYGLRWQGTGLRIHPPEPGEETLVVFTSQPYRAFTAARFARVIRTDREEGALRLVLELGSRALVRDDPAWERYVLAGPNPSEESQVWAFRAEEDHAVPERAPVAYADAAQDTRAWRGTIERLAADADYASAVFLRIAAVRPATEPGARDLSSPYRLEVDRPYHVAIASYNPHLTEDALRTMRLAPFFDDLATALVASTVELPRDGTLDLAVEPIVPGPGWLELNVSRGDEVVLAGSLGWVATAAPAGTPPSGARTVTPSDSAITEREGLALYELGRYAEAEATLGPLPMDALSPEGRATLVGAWLRQGRLPEPLDRVRVADLSRDSTFRLVLDASAGLEADDQVALARFVVRRLVSDERAIAWLSALVDRRLPAGVTRTLFELWEALDPTGAAAARDRLDRERPI